MFSVRTRRLVILISALALLVAACGGDSAEERLVEEIMENSGEVGDVDIDLDEDGDSFSINVQGEDGEDVSISGSGNDEEFEMTIEGEDGEVMTIGGGDVPEGMTIPYPPGGDVMSSLSSGSEISVTLTYPGTEFDSVVSFYDDALNPDSDDVDRQESSFTSDDGTFRNVFWTSSEGDWTVGVNDCYGMEGDLDSACVSIFESVD